MAMAIQKPLTQKNLPRNSMNKRRWKRETENQKRPQIVSVVIALACLICLILVIDFVVRTVTRANVTYVVSEGTFSTDNNNGIPEATDKPTEAKDDKKAMKQLLPQK